MATVKDVMTTKLVTVNPETPLDEALKKLLVNSVHRLLVVDSKDPSVLHGIVSDRDLRMAADSPMHKETPQIIEQLKKNKVEEIMTKSGIVTTEESAPILEAVKLMRVSKVGGLPVVAVDGKVVGIITRTDLMDHLIRLLEPSPPE